MPDDTPAMLGHQGQFTVVYQGNTLVAFNKLSCLGPGEWWLEGIRVDPNYRQQGIARQLHTYTLALADERMDGFLRLSTVKYNEAINKLARETGFRTLAYYSLATAAAAESVAGQLLLHRPHFAR